MEESKELIRGSFPAAEDYLAAEPFPYAVIDGLFDADMLRQAEQEFPSPQAASWHRFDGVTEVKQIATKLSDMGNAQQNLINQLMSEGWVKEISNMAGIPDLIPFLRGGGLHMTVSGGFLGIHADFNRHGDFYRRINSLLFLNEFWEEEWGSHLELWNGSRCVKRIAPIFNRLVLFNTSDKSFHGHPAPLRCPVDRARKSIAVYYFTKQAPFGSSKAHSTIFLNTGGSSSHG